MFLRRRPRAADAAILTSAIVLAACGVKQDAFDAGMDDLRQELRGEIQSGDQDLGQQIGQTNARVTSFEERLNALDRELDAMRSEFSAQIERLSGMLRFNVPVHFAFDSDEVRQADQAVLDRFANVVREFYPNATITVEGFTDASGPAEYNLALGQRRADNVRQYLTAQGLSADHIRTVSYGEAPVRQIVPGARGPGEAGLENRRVALVIDYSGDGR